MRPDWKIEADGQDVTDAIAARLISLEVTDEAGFDADEIAITIDNRGGELAPPRRGAVLKAAMGFAGAPLIEMGAFTVDEVEESFPPRILSIRGRGADLRAASLKTRRDQTYEGTTVGDVVKAIAERNGLNLAVQQPLLNLAIPYLAQRGESDLNLLTRLADQYRFATAIKTGHGIAFIPGSGQTASGAPAGTLPSAPAPVAAAFSESDLSSWRVREADRDAGHGAVTALWFDQNAARERSVTVGEGEPSKVLPQRFDSEAEARRGAEGELDRLGRAGGALEITLPIGRPELKAGVLFSLSGLGALGDGRWHVIRASHSITGEGGFTSRIEGERIS